MGGDRGPEAVVPAALATLERDDSVNLTLVGLPDVLEQAQAAGQRSLRLAARVQAGDRSRVDGRAAGRCVAPQEGFLAARGHRAREERRGRCVRQLRQHRRADGDGPLRAEDAARYRSAGDHFGRARSRGPDVHARSRCQRRLHAGAPAAVRVDGLGRRRGHARDRAAARRSPQHRARGHQGQRDRARSGRAARRRAA